ncbi:MAG: Ig-like domain-containing protein, partial [Pseudomonadota bacterium]
MALTFACAADAPFNGTDTFDSTVSDGNAGTDTGTVTVTVTAVNDEPVFS